MRIGDSGLRKPRRLGNVRIQHRTVDGQRSAVDKAKSFQPKEKCSVSIRKVVPVSTVDKLEIQ